MENIEKGSIRIRSKVQSEPGARFNQNPELGSIRTRSYKV